MNNHPNPDQQHHHSYPPRFQNMHYNSFAQPQLPHDNNFYPPRHSNYHQQPPNTTKIYIGQLPLDIQDADVYNAFGGLIEIADLKIVKGNASGSFNKTCYAFVNVKGNEQQAAEAVNRISQMHPSWKANLKSQYDRATGNTRGPRDFYQHQSYTPYHNAGPYSSNTRGEYHDRGHHQPYFNQQNKGSYHPRPNYPNFSNSYNSERTPNIGMSMGGYDQRAGERGIKSHKILVREIWIGGIPEGLDEAVMHNIMGQFGMVESMELFAKFAFVKFKLVNDATNAFEKTARMHELLGRPHGLRVFFSDPEKRTGVVSNCYEFDRQSIYLPILFIGFPPITSADVQQNNMRSICDKYGTITNMYIRKSNDPQMRSYILVSYDTVANAIRARKELSKRRDLVGDKRIEVAVLLDEQPILRGRNLEYTLQKFQNAGFDQKKGLPNRTPLPYGNTPYYNQPNNPPVQSFGYPGYMNNMPVNLVQPQMNMMHYYGVPQVSLSNPTPSQIPLSFSNQVQGGVEINRTALEPNASVLHTEVAESGVSQLIRDALRDGQDEKEPPKEVLEGAEPDWSGFLIRNRLHRVVVDGFAREQKFNFEDSMINVSFVIKLNNLSLKNKKHTMVLQASNQTGQKTFEEYIEYFKRKESAGVSIGYKQVIFLLPKCKQADEILVIGEKQILIVVEDISAYYELKDKFQKADD